MEIKELSYSFFKYWKEPNWQELTNLIHENVKFNLFWCDLELQGKENFLKALKEGKNSFSIREIELINSTECGGYSISEWKGVHTNNSGELESFKKLLIFNWDEKKIIKFRVFETIVVDINSVAGWIDSI